MLWSRLDIRKRFLLAALGCLCIVLTAPLSATAFSKAERDRFQRTIVDYRSRLNPRYKKIKRKHTRYIIVHTAELGHETSLRVVSRGKQFRDGRFTYGGHAHYVIARNGRTCRIMAKEWIAC